MCMSFNTQIQYGNKMLDAQFNKVACPSGKYFIEVNNSADDVIASFEMQKDHYNKWKITNPVPEWIIGLEVQFEQAIIENQFVTL